MQEKKRIRPSVVRGTFQVLWSHARPVASARSELTLNVSMEVEVAAATPVR